MNIVAAAVVAFSVLTPTRTWYAPSMPLAIKVQADQDVNLILTDFLAKRSQPAENAVTLIKGGRGDIPNLREVFPELNATGTYMLYAVPAGKPLDQFLGTPLLIDVKEDPRREAPPGPMVFKVEPLRYARITTAEGTCSVGFYYDVAPNTVANFVQLAQEGFYDGLTFNRIIPDILVQGGDPRGDRTGGPGHLLRAEFNDRPHNPGAISMARSPIDPNSAGSQFYICLDDPRTAEFDRKYTVFAHVIDGMDVLRKLGKTPLAPGTADRPAKPPVIEKIEIVPVTAADNPYRTLVDAATAKAPTTAPATKPAR